MNKSPWKNVPDIGIELGATCMPISRGIFTPTLGILTPTVLKIKFVFFDNNFSDK